MVFAWTLIFCEQQKYEILFQTKVNNNRLRGLHPSLFVKKLGYLHGVGCSPFS